MMSNKMSKKEGRKGKGIVDDEKDKDVLNQAFGGLGQVLMCVVIMWRIPFQRAC